MNWELEGWPFLKKKNAHFAKAQSGLKLVRCTPALQCLHTVTGTKWEKSGIMGWHNEKEMLQQFRT